MIGRGNTSQRGSICALMRGKAEANSDTEAFNKGIAAVGDTLDLFNLFYVSSVREEYGKETEHNFIQLIEPQIVAKRVLKNVLIISMGTLVKREDLIIF